MIKTILMALPVFCVVAYYAYAVDPHKHGDLGRLGFIGFDDDYDAYVSRNALQSSLVNDVSDVDEISGDSTILVIGDSFTDQRSGYASYLATFYPGYTVYNLKYKDVDDRYQYVVDLLKQDIQIPSIIIVESVERHVTERLNVLDFDKEYNVNADSVSYIEKTEEDIIPSSQSFTEEGVNDQLFPYPVKVIMSGYDGVKEETEELHKLLLNTQTFIKKNLYITENPVRHMKTKKKMFSCKGSEDDLYVYEWDLFPTEKSTAEGGLKNLEKLYSLAKQRNKTFVFMVASDKYDLYKKFVKKDPYKIKGRLDYFKDYNDKVWFVNSKMVLIPHLVSGEKDIYKCNDTHWSVTSAKYVAEEIKKRIDAQR